MTAIGFSHLHLLPRFQAPCLKRSPARQRRYTGMTYAAYSPSTPIDTTAKNAIGTPAALPDSAGRLMIPASTHEPTTAATGTPRAPLTLAHSLLPGVILSRE